MSGDDRVLGVAGEWVLKAENDLRNATHTLELRDECPTDTVCFHAQECVEKYIKAVLTLEQIDHPRTHNVDQLMALLPGEVRPRLSEAEQDRLTEYATVTRYPGDYEPIDLAEAHAAVELARRVRRHIRDHLPAKVLGSTNP